MESPRFTDFYVVELLDLIQDEDHLIQLDSLEAITQVLEHIEPERITSEYIPQVQ